MIVIQIAVLNDCTKRGSDIVKDIVKAFLLNVHEATQWTLCVTFLIVSLTHKDAALYIAASCINQI